ncbi:MAG TPA: T9SS type A sorting domain-containing protein, partial [Chitinophagales bacterium]|nr:T9SS type A sorting domain-containing protein [Chitinophagales bacterium]
GNYYDYWVVKLAGPACTPAPEMCNLIDDDCDGLIDEGASPAISISAGGATTFCQGSNVILTATHTGTGLQWKKNGTTIPGATGVTYAATKTGIYTCESSNACGATLSASISVTANKNPPASITAGGPTSFCAGGSVVLTANAGGGLSYQWYKGATPIAGATNIAYTASTAGNYKCRVTKTATGCFKNSNAIMVSIVCRGGENETPSQILYAYPNPATTQLNITCSANINTAQLYNGLGQLIMEISVSDGYAEADISTLTAGMYLIRAGGEVAQWVKQ